MDREALRLFLEVATARSFSRAAASTHIPKQTVSRRIRELERALGYDLFHRTTRSVRLTEEGERFRLLAEEATDIFARMEHVREISSAPPRGVLRMHCDPLFGETFLSPALQSFLKRYPEIEVETSCSARRADLIAEGLDVAFRIGPLRDSSERVRPLGPARVRYCASPRYLDTHGRPQKPSDLSRHQCLALHYEGGGTQRWLFRKGRKDEWLSVSGRVRSNSFRLLYDAARADLGIVASPAFYCEADLRRERLESVLDDWLPDFGTINLVYPPQQMLPAKVRVFVDHVSEWFGKRPIP